jgi:hypothetical protein
MVQLAAFSLALAGGVYAIGWLVTWVRLAAARLPIEASLPMIQDRLVFAAGLRTVVLMAVVFGAMCALAYATHTWTWRKRAPEWHDVVRLGRADARALRNPPSWRARVRALRNPPSRRARVRALHNPPSRSAGAQALEGAVRPRPPLPKPSLHALKPQSAPADLHEAAIGDPFVRVIAGFNVGVLAAALGLAGARVVKPLIDQIEPGQWWALLGPWALFAIVAALFFAWVGPLRGGRVVHAIVWAGVVAVALLSCAPIGLLLLTWAGIATLGRSFARRHSRPGSKLEFVLSPLPWILLTIYALVGLAYYATPPVSFPRTIVSGASGTRAGGYLARTSAGVYLVLCTPLADATSTGEAVSFIPAGEVGGMITGGSTFSVDSGARPSLPTLALRLFGIDASTPTWIRPDLRARRATCAGAPPPRPSVGSQAPWLGAGVTAGPAPPNGRAHGGEPPIEQTTPALAALARRFQPTILVTVADRFWPVSVGALLEDLGGDGQPACLRHTPGSCAVRAPKLTDLRRQGSGPGDFLEYPATPALDPDPTGQLDAFLRGQRGRETPVPSLHQWLADPGLLDPWYTAQVYFYYAGRADPSRWPAPNRGIPSGLIALEYWFFYPYNYYPTAATPELMNEAPIAGDVLNTDLHQGDWEHIDVLLDPRTLTPRWLYMARHSDEGRYFPWDSPLLSFDQGHPIVQAAFGGHPTYEAHCGAHLRFAHGLAGRVSDWVVCGSGRFAFRAATTPLVDIASTPWACWEGHFGIATPTEAAAAQSNEGSVQRAIDDYVLVAGPRSPLWQAENGRLKADGAPADTGVCAGNGDPQAPELAALRGGAGIVAGGQGRGPGKRTRH